MSTVAIVLALDSDLPVSPAVLQPVLGDPSLLWVLRALPAPAVSAAIVLSDGRSDSIGAAVERWSLEELLPCTTAHATWRGDAASLQSLTETVERAKATDVLILRGDAPLLHSSTIQRLALSRGSMLLSDEEPPQAALVCALPWERLKAELAGGPHEEISFPDAVKAALQCTGAPTEACEPHEHISIRSHRDLAVIQGLARDHINGRWMDEGVLFLDASSAFVGPRVHLAGGVVIEPCVQLKGAVTVAEAARIGQGCVIQDCRVGTAAELRPYCVVQQAEIGAGVKLGPFAHLREGSVLEDHVHVGNFVETKKTTLRAGAKANHLSYLGDTEVGARTNIGAGFISCNYDGYNKHRTIIGSDAFVGSDCQLVAPVTIGNGAILGAGSTITSDIPADALALTRAPLVVKDGAAQRLREKLQAKKRKS